MHHASEDLEWTSASRFHPVNLALGSGLVDIVAFLCGISPGIFVVVGPFDIITSCMVHANLNWTFGPLRYVFVSPVFHRWHHAESVGGKNFASTFALWDVMFGTYHISAGPRAAFRNYRLREQMPEGLMPRPLYPDPASASGPGSQAACFRRVLLIARRSSKAAWPRFAQTRRDDYEKAGNQFSIGHSGAVRAAAWWSVIWLLTAS